MEETPAPYVAKETVQFGTKEALKGETPKPIKWIYKGLFIISSVFTLATISYPEIPQDIQLHVLKAFTFGNAVIYFICQQFGWVVKKPNE